MKIKLKPFHSVYVSLMKIALLILKFLDEEILVQNSSVRHHDYKKVEAKIALPECISYGEMNIWTNLNHENILTVTKVEEDALVYAFIFYVSVYPASLGEIIQIHMFYTYLK